MTDGSPDTPSRAQPPVPAMMRDRLTGLWNRRSTLTLFRSIISQQAPFLVNAPDPERYPVAMLLGDLEDVREVNDTYGHAETDILLVLIAKALARVVSDRGLVGRIGGDEFLVVLPGVTSEELTRHAEWIRAAVPDAVTPQGARTTMSLGGSAWSPEPVTAENLHRFQAGEMLPDPDTLYSQLFEACDAALREAKQLSPNRYLFRPLDGQ